MERLQRLGVMVLTSVLVLLVHRGSASLREQRMSMARSEHSSDIAVIYRGIERGIPLHWLLPFLIDVGGRVLEIE
jgi:hypothetical protein